MSRRRAGGETIAQRVANTRAAASARPDDGSGPQEPPDLRHCWYDGPHGRQAALLLEWRNRAGTWCGRVALARPEGDGWALVEMWVDAAMLAPAGTSLPVPPHQERLPPPSVHGPGAAGPTCR